MKYYLSFEISADQFQIIIKKQVYVDLVLDYYKIHYTKKLS